MQVQFLYKGREHKDALIFDGGRLNAMVATKEDMQSIQTGRQTRLRRQMAKAMEQRQEQLQTALYLSRYDSQFTFQEMAHWVTGMEEKLMQRFCDFGHATGGMVADGEGHFQLRANDELVLKFIADEESRQFE